VLRGSRASSDGTVCQTVCLFNSTSRGFGYDFEMGVHLIVDTSDEAPFRISQAAGVSDMPAAYSRESG
jgi:hypothetical protein